ncbi:MAG: extracellular solute-binding protein [Anaerolineales bacterium]|jgi:multiple sugar transport system substrate-binding protein|uniref:extracellular solute-binding protein n=1 Tax=Candidatus Villigracilis vicinus TaxID=3140679 RepID=UPI0031375CA1|nr:extracellular solute-binding protein [Anaerolineales bacterium]
MKKILPLFLVLSIILSACSATETPAGDTKPASTKQGNETETVSTEESSVETVSRLEVDMEALKGLELSVWTPWYGVEQGLFETFVSEFNTNNEWGIKVTAQSQINFTNLYEVTTASLPTEDRPDLVIALPEHAQSWFADGVTTDLTNYVEDPLYGLKADDIPFAFWSQDISSKARVAVPAQRTAQVMLWNQTWADELNINVAPASADAFRSQACRAHTAMGKDAFAENDAMGGWIVDTQPMTAYAWMLSFGGGVLEEGNYRFLSPDNIDAFKFLRELSEANCAWQGAADPISSFANREALFITVSLSDLPNVTRAFASVENRDTWVVLPFPNKNGGSIAVYGSSYIVMKSTPEEQLAAWLFVRWLLDNEQDARWVEATHLFPLRESTVNLLGDYEKNHPQWKQAVELLSQGELQPQLGSWRTIKVMLGDGFAHMYRVNVPSGQVAAILAQMETMAKDLSK